MTSEEEKARRRKQTLRRTKEWHQKRLLTRARSWSRFHPIEAQRETDRSSDDEPAN